MWPTGHETHCQSPGEGLVSPIPKTCDFWGKYSQHYPGEQLIWPLSLTYSFPAQLWGGFWQMLRSWLDCPPLVTAKPHRHCLPSSLVAAHTWVHTHVCAQTTSDTKTNSLQHPGSQSPDGPSPKMLHLTAMLIFISQPLRDFCGYVALLCRARRPVGSSRAFL